MNLPPRAAKRYTESTLLAECREWANAQPDVRVWRNNVGKLQDANGRWVSYGLGIGSPDLIGVVRVPVFVVGEDARGIFLGAECKLVGARVSSEQEEWLMMIERFGGVAGIVRSVDDMRDLVERARAVGA